VSGVVGELRWEEDFFHGAVFFLAREKLRKKTWINGDLPAAGMIIPISMDDQEVKQMPVL
jgi:hypothetical protein